MGSDDRNMPGAESEEDPWAESDKAIETKDLRAFKRLAAADPALPHTRNDLGDTPLHYAAWHGATNIVRFLLRAGADVNARGNDGYAPLHYAARYGKAAAARAVLAAGAVVDAVNDFGFTPLFIAVRARADTRRLVRVLLDAGATVDLNTAVCLGDVDRVRAILAADPNAARTARFPGMLATDAVIAGSAEMLDLILAAGADPNGVAEGSPHPLFAALGDAGLVNKLLAAGADPNAAQDRAGRSVLTRARRSAGPGVIDLLVRAGARE
jgi:ankyrin repeat protein